MRERIFRLSVLCLSRIQFGLRLLLCKADDALFGLIILPHLLVKLLLPLRVLDRVPVILVSKITICQKPIQIRLVQRRVPIGKITVFAVRIRTVILPIRHAVTVSAVRRIVQLR